MFQIFTGRNKKRVLKLPPGLSRKEQKQVTEIIERARKNDGIPRTAQQSIPFDRMFPDGICLIGIIITRKPYNFQTLTTSWPRKRTRKPSSRTGEGS